MGVANQYLVYLVAYTTRRSLCPPLLLNRESPRKVTRGNLHRSYRPKDLKTTTLHMNSRCAFTTTHVHGMIYRERGLLTTRGYQLSNACVTEYQALLLDHPWIGFLKSFAINLATILSDDDITQKIPLRQKVARPLTWPWKGTATHSIPQHSWGPLLRKTQCCIPEITYLG